LPNIVASTPKICAIHPLIHDNARPSGPPLLGERAGVRADFLSLRPRIPEPSIHPSIHSSVCPSSLFETQHKKFPRLLKLFQIIRSEHLPQCLQTRLVPSDCRRKLPVEFW